MLRCRGLFKEWWEWESPSSLIMTSSFISSVAFLQITGGEDLAYDTLLLDHVSIDELVQILSCYILHCFFFSHLFRAQINKGSMPLVNSNIADIESMSSLLPKWDLISFTTFSHSVLQGVFFCSRPPTMLIANGGPPHHFKISFSIFCSSSGHLSSIKALFQE